MVKNNIHYSEKKAAIDLITDSYKDLNPFEIIQKAKSDLKVTLTFTEVTGYLEVKEDLEIEKLFKKQNREYNGYDRQSRMY